MKLTPAAHKFAVALLVTLSLTFGLTLLLRSGGKRVNPQQNAARVDGQPKASESSRAWADEVVGRTPMAFEENAGQTDARVKFLSRGQGYSLFLTPDEAVMTLSKPAAKSDAPQ